MKMIGKGVLLLLWRQHTAGEFKHFIFVQIYLLTPVCVLNIIFTVLDCSEGRIFDLARIICRKQIKVFSLILFKSNSGIRI